MSFPDPRPWRNDELKAMADDMEEVGIPMGTRLDRMAAADHRTDFLFDAFCTPNGDRFAVYTNKDRTHFKITITEDFSVSVEFDGDLMRRAMLIIEDALSRPDR